MNIITIGIYLTKSKKNGILWDQFINYCEKYNNKSMIHCNFVKLVDVTEDNYNKIKFDKVLTKFDEFYIEKNISNQIILYLSSLNNKIMDSLKNQINVGNRLIMADKLTDICKHFDNLFVPRYVCATKLNYCPDLNFPLICKPNAAFGSSITHDMCIVNNYTDLLNAKLQLPILLQNYHEHNGIIYKVYVIKNNIHVCIKNSISLENDNRTIYFNTSNLKKQPINCDNLEQTILLQEFKNNIDLIKLSGIISNIFGLTLFGYDIIKVKDKYAIIDVNYFPGYSGFKDFYKCLLNYFIE